MVLSIQRFFLLMILAAIPVAALAQPTARSGARMAFSEQSGAIILFGGLTAADSSQIRYGLSDTWEWSGRRWVRLLPANRPNGRGEHVMVSDSNRDRIV